MGTVAMFPDAPMRARMYESFFLRAVCPDRPLGVWIRATVHKPAGLAAQGSVWCTVFDAHAPRPFMHKFTSTRLRQPSGGWIEIGAGRDLDAGEGAILGPGEAIGSCGEARWSLSFDSPEPELRHLSPSWLYGAPLPRTKLTSPAPAAIFYGRLALPGREPITMHAWRGTVGHNWGSEHAERWIWLHGIDFDGEPDAWLDLVLGRVRVAGRLTPWVASGSLSVGGARRRLGGLLARGTHVREDAQGAKVALGGRRGESLEVAVEVPTDSAAGWLYADPGGREREVVNCSIAAMRIGLRAADGTRRTLRTGHGGAYELGMLERDHGVPIAPFPA